MMVNRHRRHQFFSGPKRERLFRRGDIKYIILDLLKDKPSYGYEIIRALQERFHGFYILSPGTVYPTLQMFEEMSYVTSSVQDGKKTYTITGAGRQFLAEREERVEKRMKERWNPQNINDIRETMSEFERLAQLLRDRARTADTAKLSRMRKALSSAYEEISKD